MRIFAAFVFCVFLGGCALNKPLASQAIAFNKATEEFNNKQILLNIVRASRREPMYFTSFTDFSGSLSVERSLSIGGAFKENASNDSGSLSVGGKKVDKPSFSMRPLDNKEFSELIAKPITPGQLQVFLRQGWPIDMLGYMLFGSIEVNGIKFSTFHSDDYKATGGKRPNCNAGNVPKEGLPLSCLLVYLNDGLEDTDHYSIRKARAFICRDKTSSSKGSSTFSMPANKDLIPLVRGLQKEKYTVTFKQDKTSETSVADGDDKTTTTTTNKTQHIEWTAPETVKPYLCIQSYGDTVITSAKAGKKAVSGRPNPTPASSTSGALPSTEKPKIDYIAIPLGRVEKPTGDDSGPKTIQVASFTDPIDPDKDNTSDSASATIVSGGIRLLSVQGAVYHMGELVRAQRYEQLGSKEKPVYVPHPDWYLLGHEGQKRFAPLIDVQVAKPLCFFDETENCSTKRDAVYSVDHLGQTWVVPRDPVTSTAVGRSTHVISFIRHLLILSTNKDAVAPIEQFKLITG